MVGTICARFINRGEARDGQKQDIIILKLDALPLIDR